MTKWILILILFNNIFANTNYIDIYRKYGSSAVLDQLDKTLQNEQYWKKYLQNFDTTYGYYEFDRYIILANKTDKTLKLLQYKNKHLKTIFQKTIIIGKNGQKHTEGDLITPVGTYDITSNFIPQDQFYGPTAFSLSYPNLLDRLNNRDGHGIWIHGYPLDNSPRDDNSKGCLVLDNKQLIKLKNIINYKKTIVIISQNKTPTTTKSDLAKILAFLYKWRDSWAKADLQTYISYYDKNFKRYDGKNLKQFIKYKKLVFQNKSKKIILFNDISIFPYPNLKSQKIYKITFNEFYKSNTYQFNGYKKLFIKFDKNNNPKIIIEQ